MDTPITKRLIISGLSTSITVDDISRRLTTFGTVKATDGFGLTDGLGQPRKFGYVTLETTTGKLAKCMNLLSGSTWKGAKLRFGEAKPDFKEKVALENKAAAEGPPPKKRRRTNEGSQAEDMSLVTSANVKDRLGWQVSSLGRMTRPVKMRPVRPLPKIQEEKPNPTLKTNQVRDVGTTKEEKKKKDKRIKDPDSRARRRTIDMTKWGSVHLKGMFLNMPSLGMKRLKLDDSYDPTIESDDNEESGDDNDKMKASQASERTISSGTPPSPPLPTNPINNPGDIPTTLPTYSIKSQSQPSVGQVEVPLPNNNIDLEVEKTQSLSLLVSLFGGDDNNWVHPESVGSDIDVDELMKRDAMLVEDNEDDGIEVVPIESDMAGTTKLQNEEEEENEQETENPVTQKSTEHSTKLKDLFAPREEEAGFSLLGHLDLDLELDNEVPYSIEQPTSTQEQAPTYTPLPSTTLSNHSYQAAPIFLNPKQALFFPYPQQQEGTVNKARQKDIFDLIKDNHWNWRDPSVGFYRTGTEDDIRKRWEEGKSELTKGWKKRWREAGKANRWRRNDVDIGT